jgi:hypothetical protein
MGDLVQQLTTNAVVAGLSVFAISLGFFSINYLNRRRQMLHQERMASLIKGLHYAGVARDIFGKPKNDGREHVLRGLRWLLGAAGVSGAMYGQASLQPTFDWLGALRGALIGLIPGAIGLAHLIFAWISARRLRREQQQVVPGGLYRSAARRY